MLLQNMRLCTALKCCQLISRPTKFLGTAQLQASPDAALEIIAKRLLVEFNHKEIEIRSNHD